MIYFTTKKDLQFLLSFKKDVKKLFEIENSIDLGKNAWMIGSRQEIRSVVISKSQEKKDYQETREKINRSLVRIKKLAHKNGIGQAGAEYPAPAIGGPIIDQNLFDAITFDNTRDGIPRVQIFDTIDKLVGAIEQRIRTEFLKIINPLFWLKEVVFAILRIPFILVSATGFNVEKFEDKLVGKLIKAAELIGIGLLGYLLNR